MTGIKIRRAGAVPSNVCAPPLAAAAHFVLQASHSSAIDGPFMTLWILKRKHSTSLQSNYSAAAEQHTLHFMSHQTNHFEAQIYLSPQGSIAV